MLFNRYSRSIVECKDSFILRTLIYHFRYSRSIVECKESISKKKREEMLADIVEA